MKHMSEQGLSFKGKQIYRAVDLSLGRVGRMITSAGSCSIPPSLEGFTDEDKIKGPWASQGLATSGLWASVFRRIVDLDPLEAAFLVVRRSALSQNILKQQELRCQKDASTTL